MKENVDRLQAVFDGVSDGLLVADLDSRRFVMANRAFCELSGYDADEVMRLGMQDIHPPESLSYAAGWFARQARGEAVVAPDIPLKRKDGRIVLCDVSAAPLVVSGRRCLMGSFRDTSERRRLEQDLRLKNFVFHSAMTANSIADTNGVIVEANQAFLRIWGFASIGDVVGRKVIDFLAHRDEAMAIIASLDATGAWEGEYTARRGDGSTFLAHSLATVVRDENGRVVGYQSAVLDITERKRAEEEHEHLRAQLVQAQKLESVGRLAGGVAHDFNNMLGVILGYSDLLLEDMPPGDPNRTAVMGIRSAAQRSSELTRQLLALARKQPVMPRVLDLDASVGKSIEMLRRLIGEDIELAWKPGGGAWRVRIDPSQVDQILTNLCVNARDAIDGVGTITIETSSRTVRETGEGVASSPGPGDYVVLAVSDTGCGMSQEVLQHIFEPFFTTKGVGQGTGLGLAMVYGIVKQNGGFVNVSSEPGQGALFRIYLPRNRDELGGEAERNGEPVARGKPVTVLLVEDEPMLLEMARRMLENLGYQVLAAGTPGEALRIAAARPASIELLVTDVVMPEMNGIELAARLSALKPGLKRLFISGYTANAFARDGLLDRDMHFLQKPFSRLELAAAVSACLEAGPDRGAKGRQAARLA